MPSSYQVVLWKQESFVVLRPLHIEFFRNLLVCLCMRVMRIVHMHMQLQLTQSILIYFRNRQS